MEQFITVAINAPSINSFKNQLEKICLHQMDFLYTCSLQVLLAAGNGTINIASQEMVTCILPGAAAPSKLPSKSVSHNWTWLLTKNDPDNWTSTFRYSLTESTGKGCHSDYVVSQPAVPINSKPGNWQHQPLHNEESTKWQCSMFLNQSVYSKTVSLTQPMSILKMTLWYQAAIKKAFK